MANYRTAQEKSRVSASQLQEKRANQGVLYQNWLQADAQIKEAQARVSQAVVQVEGARAKAETVQTAPEQVAEAKAETRASRSDVLLAKANYDQALLNLSYCTIKAPIAGRVGRRTVDVGNYVAPGQTLLSVISDDRWVVANFKETQLTQMKIGQRAKITIDAYPSLDLHAKLDSFQPGTGARFSLLPPENASGNWVKVVQRVPVRFVFVDKIPDNIDLAPGMSVTVTVELDSPTGDHARKQ
jgi:membrane fusion protein (multidrug efflux system)